MNSGNCSGKLSPLDSSVIEGFLCKDDKILEIGSGTALTFNYLINAGYNITGTDILPQDKGIIKASAENLPFADNSFNSVIMECVFSLCNPLAAAKEIFRVLKKGGRVITSDIFSSGDTIITPNISAVKTLYSYEEYTSCFSDFSLVKFEDRTDDMIQMMCNAVLKEGSCLSLNEIKQLSSYKPCYGLWVFEK